jgi:hypothetical protein
VPVEREERPEPLPCVLVIVDDEDTPGRHVGRRGRSGVAVTSAARSARGSTSRCLLVQQILGGAVARVGRCSRLRWDITRTASATLTPPVMAGPYLPPPARGASRLDGSHASMTLPFADLGAECTGT